MGGERKYVRVPLNLMRAHQMNVPPKQDDSANVDLALDKFSEPGESKEKWGDRAYAQVSSWSKVTKEP
jgi:hypothetical protein